MQSLETYARAVHGEILLWQGQWAAAEDAATDVIDSSAHVECVAARILGTMQARQARPGATATLERMWTLAEASGELQLIDPAGSALAEHMWLTGERPENFVAKLREIFDRGVRIGPPWPSGAFVFWWWELGELSDVPEGVPDEYRLIIEGEPLAAAEMWAKFGCPYERAIALSHGEQDAQLEALEILETLGATAVAAKLRQSLRGQGVRVARGKGRTTRSNAGGLTARQAEILSLLAEGLSNVDMADRLFLSPRTVEHHVAAVMSKLNASSRDEAVATAAEQGLLASR
jgi:DNA-binding CsgD family transcriptional regulator